MTTLQAALQAKAEAITRRLSLRVFIGDQLFIPIEGEAIPAFLGISSLEISKSFASPVPVCRISVPRIPNWVREGMRLRVDIGFDDLIARVFTGHIQTHEPAHDEAFIVGLGSIYNLFRKTEVAQRNVDLLTVEQAITNILDSAGITARELVSIPAFTLGTVGNQDAVLERGALSQMLTTLMEIDGLRMYETGDGVLRIEQAEAGPASVPYRVLSTITAQYARLIGGRMQADSTAIKTRVTITGATITTGTPPDETSVTITGAASIQNHPLIIPPIAAGEYIDAEFGNHLIDTTAKAADMAARKLSELAKFPRQISIEVPGDPQFELGQTVYLEFPELPVKGLFQIHGLRHTINSSGYLTILDLFGGTGISITPQVHPQATFSYTLRSQVIADRVYVIARFDGSGSHDPDGRIVSWAWSDNQATTPDIATITTDIAEVIIDPAAVSGQWDVTLTVTDDDGLTDSFTAEDVPVDVGVSPITIPAIFAALENNVAISPDGGRTWNDTGVTGTTAECCSSRPAGGELRGEGVFGYADGSIWLVTNYLGNGSYFYQVKPPSGVAITDVMWDWRNSSFVWAVDVQARVFRSSNFGRSWSLYDALRTKLSHASARLDGIALPEGALGSVIVFGGDGAGNPLIAVEPVIGHHNWYEVVYDSGELGADLPGGATLTVKDMAYRNTQLAIIFDNAGSGVLGVYFADNPGSSSPAWRRAQGISSALVNGRYIVPGDLPGEFYAAFNDRDVYATTNGVNWTKRANVMPSGVTPNACRWSGESSAADLGPDLYGIAAENAGATLGLYVSTDALQSVSVIRPVSGFSTWPASAKGKQIDFGKSLGGDSRVLTTLIKAGAATRWSAKRINFPQWTHTSIATALTGKDIVTPRVATGSLWFLLGFDDKTAYATAVGLRSANAGVSWAAMAAPIANHVWQDVRAAADGSIWGLTLDSTALGTAKIWRSTAADAGADTFWVLKDTYSETGTRLTKLVTHPTDARRVAAIGIDTTDNTLRVRFTTDGGSTWSVNAASAEAQADNGHQTDYLMLQASSDQNNRIIAAGLAMNASAVTQMVKYSDDMGGSWLTTVGDVAGNAATTTGFILGPVGNFDGTLLFVILHDNLAEQSYVVRSRDGGRTWVKLTLPVPRFNVDDDPNGGIAYSEAEHALYIANKGGHAGNSYYVWQMKPAEDLTSWADFTAQLIPTGETAVEHTDPGQAIVVIP